MHSSSDTYDFVALALLLWVCFVALVATYALGREAARREQQVRRAKPRYCVSCRAQIQLVRKLTADPNELRGVTQADESGVNEVPRARN